MFSQGRDLHARLAADIDRGLKPNMRRQSTLHSQHGNQNSFANNGKNERTDKHLQKDVANDVIQGNSQDWQVDPTKITVPHNSCRSRLGYPKPGAGIQSRGPTRPMSEV